ncbi:RluA family pseudouridine synthase [Bartonella sp. TP]|uniref:RluA family pseudouridine synthase n=1 Tax=Bartonella sp. TP TaxID=3057550 RepID=UPI0025AFDC8D|nr:RluA family pseudouridine synthase [Bartonella sp. TP]WJW79837.1 RluA family pseudouridine synthase [Bartonella sp. TP]
MTIIKNVNIVSQEEQTMRLDRWFKIHHPQLSYVMLQKLLRSGQIRLDGKRAKANVNLTIGQEIRVPPNLMQNLLESPKILTLSKEQEALRKMTLYEDEKLLVLNKPYGLAVQGGSGIERHVDSMLEALRNKKGEKPRLVHRLDKDTSGVLVVAKTRSAASFLAAAFRGREAKKIYWSLVRGTPKPHEGKISTWLVKEATEHGDKVRVCKHGQVGADHAVSYYKLLETAGQNLSWLEMQPFTGRTHQLRVHAAFINHPIIGDPKYFCADTNWCFPGGIQNRLHLHARRLIMPHPSGGKLDVTADLPAHMVQSFNLLGFDKTAFA